MTRDYVKETFSQKHIQLVSSTDYDDNYLIEGEYSSYCLIFVTDRYISFVIRNRVTNEERKFGFELRDLAIYGEDMYVKLPYINQ